MNLPDGLLADEWTVAAWLLFIPVLLLSLSRAPLRRLADATQGNVWLGLVVVLTLLWSVKAGVRPGLSLHLLGASVFVLACGPWLAFLGLCAVLAGVTLNGDAGWQGYALNALLMAGVGVAVAYAVQRSVERFLPQQLFVYIFANGFLTAALTVIGVGILSSLLLGLAGVYAWDYLWAEYFPYFLLLGFAEAWLSGMLMTLFVVYRPSWVSTFDDRHYLDGH